MQCDPPRFFKAHGLGNDYAVIEWELDLEMLSQAAIVRLCDRHEGLGADGLLIPVPSSRAPIGVRIFNPDGSEAEKSGNGLRIFARYLYERKVLRDACAIETPGGIVLASRTMSSESAYYSVEMGHAILGAHGRDGFCSARQILYFPSVSEPIEGYIVSMGNPHFVCFIEDPEAVPISSVGPRIEHHTLFPNRTNVQFARVISRSRVQCRIWERGVGETRASGSSACAVVAAGQALDWLDAEVEVEMPGGCLKVWRSESGSLHQSGPVDVVAEGRLAPEFLQRLLMSK